MDEEIRTRLKETSRNDPCPCGSGKKYKKCHQESDSEARREADRVLAKQQAPEVVEEESAGQESEEQGKKKPAPVRFQPKRRSEKVYGGSKSASKGKKTNIPRRSNG